MQASRLKIRVDKWAFGYAVLLIVIACAAVKSPKSNYDGLFYTALTSRITDAQALQKLGLQFEQHRPDDFHSAYREDLRQNPYHFAEQLPFYSVKPLYVAALTLITACGMGWRSGAILSGVSFCLLGGVVWSWLRRYYSSIETAALSSILLLNPAVVRLVRWTTPDILATLIAVSGTYIILEKERPVAGIGMLIVGIWVRPEILVFTGLVLCGVYLSSRICVGEAAALGALALGSYVIISRIGGAPYGTLFYHTFIERMTAPNEMNVAITKSAYLRVLKQSVESITDTNPILALPLAACATNFIVMRKMNLNSLLSLLALLAALVLYVSYPKPEARYYLYQLAFIPALTTLVQIKLALGGHDAGSRPSICTKETCSLRVQQTVQ